GQGLQNDDPAQCAGIGGALARHAGLGLRPALRRVASLSAARGRAAPAIRAEAAGRGAGVSEAVVPRPKRAPLGRGLAALFGETGTRPLAEFGGARTVPIESIRPSPFQPRRHFGEEELEGLAQSIRDKGIVQPLLVRPAENVVNGSGTDFELIAGERRSRRAARQSLATPTPSRSKPSSPPLWACGSRCRRNAAAAA